jgi:hypothetical protein
MSLLAAPTTELSAADELTITIIATGSKRGIDPSFTRVLSNEICVARGLAAAAP